MWLYIIVFVVAILMSTFSVVAFYFFFDSFVIRKTLKDNPRAPLTWLAIFFILYFVILWGLFIWR